MANTNQLLMEREKTHGDFDAVASLARSLKNLLKTADGRYGNVQGEALDSIATKLARIVHGDPNFADHWRDIAGYAQLVADRLDQLSQAHN